MMEPLPASYYGAIDKSNPVISAFEKNIKELKVFMKKVRDSSSFDHFSYSRGSLKLFDIWKKHEQLLPSIYYQEHLVYIADFLSENKFYRLALWQGYRRYLQLFSFASLYNIRNVEQFKQAFFPHGLHAAEAQLMFRALQGECLCTFHLEQERWNHHDHSRLEKLLSILGFLRIMMQTILPHENLSWLLYNGSLNIYNICRFLMTVGHAAQALEYLLWACVCLETCIPLLTPRFLCWRATLYCAVCECYYDGQAAVQAEVFARRALGKISELGKLEELSGLPSTQETQHAFREATIKLAVMVFKRSVYETRRKPKGIFRPKQKNNLKEGHNNTWPRSATERILMEMFVGNAAQFLAVLEALWDSSRRPLQTGIPDETEIQEVALELMSAGISLLSGNGGSSDRVHNDSLPLSINAVTPTFNLMKKAIAGENQISMDAAVKFVKLLFRYEQWDMFSSLSDKLVTVLSNMEGCLFRKAELELSLLEAMERVISAYKVRLGTKDIMTEAQTDKDKTVGIITMTDELLNLVHILHVCICEAPEDARPDGDLVLDIVLFLWAKCKLVFQRSQSRHYDSICYLAKMEHQEKWVQTLVLLCEVAYLCQLANIDPLAVAEMTLRLAMVLEAGADSALLTESKQDTNEDSSLPSTPVEIFTLFMKTRVEHLEMASAVLERGLDCISRSRTVFSPCDASAVCDTVYLQKFSETHVSLSGCKNKESTNNSCVSSLLMDLHVELLAFYHRISLRLLDVYPDEDNAEGRKRPGIQSTQRQSLDSRSERARIENALLEKIGKNKIFKALFLSQKALLSYKKYPVTEDVKKLLEEAAALIEKAGLEEKRMLSSSAFAVKASGMENGCRPPPPPVLLSCRDQTLIFTPAPYYLEEQVCWYRIYGREVEGVNLKVRIGDCHLVGTGETIPSRGERLFCVSGLEPNQKYVFAMAAYDAQGNLIGNSIGETSRPVLASLPLPLLTTWAYLAQVAYQTGQNALTTKACNELWSHFTFLPASDSGVSQEPVDEREPDGLAQTSLHQKTLQLSSSLLQQLFLTSIFMQTDIHIQEKALYCDSLADGTQLIWGQESRLVECERMMVAVDLALHLNDSSTALQAVVTCYGLLAPLIYYQIPSDPLIQVLLKCLIVLQEFPDVFKQKRPAATNESLYHMVACITHYVTKGLRALNDNDMASSVIKMGKKHMQEMSESLQQSTSKSAPVEKDQVDRAEKLQKKGMSVHETELSKQMEALEAVTFKHKKVLLNCELTALNEADGGHDPVLAELEDPALLYTIIGSSSLCDAFKYVMKFKSKPFFMEFAVLLLQRALKEDQLELLLQWKQEIFSWISWRNEGLTPSKKHDKKLGKDQEKYTTSVIEYTYKKQKISSFSSDKKKKKSQKATLIPGFDSSETDSKAWETLLKPLGSVIRRHQQRKKLRRLCSNAWPWPCHINLIMAQAYLGLLRKSLQPQSITSLQNRYSKMPLHFFSLAHTGTLLKWNNIPKLYHQITKANPQPKHRAFIHNVPHKVKDSNQGDPDLTEEGFMETVMDSELDYARTQLTNDSGSTEPAVDVAPPSQRILLQPLYTIYKASLHLRRTMVLAHRGALWTSLQFACATLWDHYRTIALLVECSQSHNSPSMLTLDQFYTVFTPLLVLASELLMDMMEKLQQWKVYDEEPDELEATPLSNGLLMDLCWLKNLVLHTLELLHYQAKWETLAHLALLYNSYTREHHTHVITPLLVHAQRRLLERISHFGGSSVPQPHFIYTESVTGEKITCRNYAGKQLLLPHPIIDESAHKGISSNAATQPLADVKRAMCLVSVPLDIEDTLCCFRESLAKKHHTIHAFQHSRTLLLRLLADTQHSKEVPFCEESDRPELNMATSGAPSIGPPDLSSEDYSFVHAVYSSTLPSSHIQTVISSYSSSIKYLQANHYNSLQIQALHDLGNLHYYNRNYKAAHLQWSKAVDCALQTSKVLESWDGDSWGSSSSQQPLKHAGIWGCLQGALFSAKIAQYILTSNINQRTQCCLLSAKLFKCLLMASLPHPDNDIEYASYSLSMKLIPGVDIFSDQSLVSNTVASLGFLCHWLYTSGHHLTTLPLLALYQYVASKVCRDTKLTVGCRILKVKVLTELSMFGEAVREIHSLTFEKVPFTHCGYTGSEKAMTQEKFRNSMPLVDPTNLQVLEKLLNSRLTEDMIALYGTRLTHRLLLAKIQLILAMCSMIHDLPEPLSDVLETPEVDESSSMKNRESTGLWLDFQKDKLTQGQVKAVLLKEASKQLNFKLFTLDHINTDPEELELAVETRLLLSNLKLQQGKSASSADLTASALRLLQDSTFFQSDDTKEGSPRKPLYLSVPINRAKQEQKSMQESDPSPQLCDMPDAVNALERMGCSLWLRCTLALIQSLTAHIPGTAICPGVDSSVEAERLLKQGLDKAEECGDPDTQALLLLQGVTLNTHRGGAPEKSASLLQEAVSLLSGRKALSHRSGLVLAKCTLLLSELRGSGGQSLDLLTQKLLQQQLNTLGECVILKAGGGIGLAPTHSLRNVYLPQLPLLARTTMHLGQCLAMQAMAGFSEEKEHVKSWLLADEVLQSALTISQASASRDLQLEADILYLKGLLGRFLTSERELQFQTVVETFLESITLTHSYSYNLKLIHSCFMEMSLIYLQQWERSTTAPDEPSPPLIPANYDKTKALNLVKATLSEKTVTPSHLVLFWVCLRAASKTRETLTNCDQLSGITGAVEGHLPLVSLRALPDFASNDLLNPCGGMENLDIRDTTTNSDADSGLSNDKLSKITWVHLSRYFSHLLNLRRISTKTMMEKCEEKFMLAAGDSSLTLKLAQLHAFFSGHLESYKDQCVISDPPAAFILEPHNIQLSHLKKPVPDLYPWAALDTQQLCIQWHCPTLELNSPSPNMMMLVFAMNKTPPSPVQPNEKAVVELEAGHRLISADSVKALHGQLMVACMETEVNLTVSTSPGLSSTSSISHKQESQQSSKSPVKVSSSSSSLHQQMLMKKIKQIFTEIQNLLKPDFKSHLEVSFEPSIQNLIQLERCFNPATGGTLEDRDLSDWLFSLLS